MTKTLGLIGAGMIGATVARLAVAAGLDVVLSNSRGPDTLADLVADLGEHARAGTLPTPRGMVTSWWPPSRSAVTVCFRRRLWPARP